MSNKRLSAAIREDVAHSGVQNLVGVNETGSVMKVQLRDLRRKVLDRDLTHLVPKTSKTGGLSMKEEIHMLEGIIARDDETRAMRETVQQSTLSLLSLQTCFSFATRMWEFAIVLILAELSGNSIFVVSLSQFLSSFTIFSLSPLTGKWLDDTNRLVSMKIILFCKLFFLTAAYVISIILLDCQSASNVEDYHIVCQIPHSLYFVPVAAAAAHLTFSVAKISLEKDWVVSLACGDKDWLSSVNSKMTQIDMICKALAPVVTGIFCSFMSYKSVSWMLLLSNCVACLCFYVFLNKLYQQCPHLAVKSYSQCNNSSTSQESSMTQEKESRNVHGILTSGCAGAIISFSCLFLTVLTFGSVMIVYLRWAGMPDHYIGLARGLSALAGFAGALVYPFARSHFGLYRTGIFAIWYQVCFVFLAAFGVYFFSEFKGGVIMVITILFSRVGLWLFDLCARQISQETIPENSRGKINGQWQSLTSFFDFSSYGLACVFSDPGQFWILTSVSFSMVVLAAVIFSFSYATSSSHDRRRDDYDIIDDLENLQDED